MLGMSSPSRLLSAWPLNYGAVSSRIQAKMCCSLASAGANCVGLPGTLAGAWRMERERIGTEDAVDGDRFSTDSETDMAALLEVLE